MLRPRQKRATGIHFDEQALYVVEMACVHGEAHLVGSARVGLEAVNGVTDLTDPIVRADLTEALEKARDQCGMRFHNPYATLREGSVLLKQRPIFYRKVSENKAQLEWEAKQFLPDDLKAYVLDCFTTTRAAFIVAARRDAIEELSSICRDVGISRPEVDVVPFALCNAAESSEAWLSDSIDLLLDFNRDHVTMILANRSELQAVVDCNWDGRYAIYGHAQAASLEDARIPSGNGEADYSKNALFFRSFFNLIRTELGDDKPDRVLLSGTDAVSGGWSKEISRRLSISTFLLNPFANIDMSAVGNEIDNPCAYATAAGLAFRGLSEA